MSSRRGVGGENSEYMRVDLKHVDEKIFQLVLRHIYADTGVELLDYIVTSDFEQFADLVLEVMAVANELMIDRLAQICQAVLGKYGQYHAPLLASFVLMECSDHAQCLWTAQCNSRMLSHRVQTGCPGIHLSQSGGHDGAEVGIPGLFACQY